LACGVELKVDGARQLILNNLAESLSAPIDAILIAGLI